MELFQRSNDARLVRDILGGRTDRYATLVARYLPAVEAVARAHVANATDAEDIAQNTFISGLQRLNTLREPAKFSHWIVRIARNKACDWISGETRERERRAAAGELLYDGRESVDTPESRELHALLHRELDLLPAEYREVLALFYFAGQGSREIAVMLELSHGAVRKRLQRGREVLGERMLRRLGGSTEGDEIRAKRAKAIYGMATATPLAWAGEGAAATSALGLGTWMAGAKVAAVVATVAVVGAGLWIGTKNADTEASSIAAPTPNRALPESKGSEVASETLVATSTDTARETPDGASPLPRGNGVIFGTVYGPDDAPLPDASVRLNLYARDAGVEIPLLYPETRSDGEGNFRFDALPHDTARYHLNALSDDGVHAGTSSALLQPDHLLSQQFLELEAAQPYWGQVVDSDGKAVANAQVRTAMHRTADGGGGSAPYVLPTATDSAGTFCFPHLGPGTWSVEVTAPAFGSQVVPLEKDGPTQITLKPGFSVSGTFVSASDGTPLANQPLWLGGVVGYARTTETDESGQFRFDHLAAGAWSLRSTGEWFSGTESVPVGENGDEATVSLTGNLGATVKGRVVLADGETGVAGMEVTAYPNPRGPNGISDEGGYFTLGHLPAGEVLALRVLENPVQSRKELRLEVDEVRNDVLLTVAEGARALSGRVINGEGEPMSGVKVEAFGQESPKIRQRMTTGGDGAFRFERIRPDDRFWVRGHREGWISRDLKLSVNKIDLDGLEIIMERPAAIVGRVVDGRGWPVSNATVHAQGPRQFAGRGTSTSQRGRFAFPRLIPGTYVLSGGTDGAVTRPIGEVTVAAGEVLSDFQLTLGEGPSEEIGGRVVDEQGAPLSGVWVNYSGHQGNHDDGSTNADERGVFLFKGLAAGVYNITARKNGYSYVVLPDVVTGSMDLVATLRPLAQLSGRVRYAQGGAPVPHYVVRAIVGSRTYFSEEDLPGATTVEDSAGRFSLDGVNAGTVTVVAWTEGYDPAYEILELDGGESRRGIELFLEAEAPARIRPPQPHTTLQGRVSEANRKPIANAYIYLDYADDQREKAVGRTGAEGQFEITVPLNTRRVFAWHDDYAPAGVALGLRDQPVNTTAIVMEPGARLQGVVSGDKGPLAHVRVSAYGSVLDQSVYRQAQTNSRGEFQLAHLVAESTKLHVYYKDRAYQFPITADGWPKSLYIHSGTAVIDGALTLDGEPIRGEIRVSIPRDDGVEEIFSISTTEGGRFYLNELPAGTLLVEAMRNDAVPLAVSVETASGAVTLVDIPMVSEESVQE